MRAMKKNNNRFSNKYLKGFLPYLLTSLVPVATLALLGIFFVFTTNIQNNYIIDKQQKDIFANINKVFSNIKTLDLELSKSINSEMFSGDINPAVYWSDPKFRDLQQFFSTQPEHLSNIDKCFIYLKDNDSIISNRGYNSAESYYDMEFTETTLKYKAFSKILDATADTIAYTNCYEDSKYFFYRTSYNNNSNIIICCAIAKTRFYSATNSNVYKSKFNIYIYNLNNRLVFSYFTYGNKNISSPAQIENFPGSKVYSMPTPTLNSELRTYLTIKQGFWTNLPVLILVFTLLILLANIVLSFIFLKRLANNNYKPLININRLINKDQIQHEYNIIEESVRALVDTNEKLEKEIQSNKDAIQDFILLQLINGDFSKELDFLLKENGIVFEHKRFIVITMSPDAFFNESATKEHLYPLIINKFKSVFNEYKTYNVRNNNQIVFIINTNSSKAEFFKRISSIIEDFLNIIKTRLYVDILIGVSSMHHDFSYINIAYLESLQAIYHKSSLVNKINLYDQLKSNSDHFEVDFENVFFKYLKNHNIKSALTALDEAFTTLKYIRPKRQLEILYSLSYTFAKIPSLLDLSVKETEQYNTAVSLPLSVDNIDFVRKKLEVFLEQYMSQFDDYDVTKSEKIVSVALDYTRKNYNNINLSLNDVANYMGYTPNYFSATFKKSYGVKWTDYLHEYRIKKAKEFINEGLPINKCIEKCGYSNQRTFNRIFKKVTGITPTDFKAKNSENKL